MINPLLTAPSDSFSLGPLTIYFYSLCILAGLVSGYFLLRRNVAKTDLNFATIEIGVIYFLIGSLLGARIGFILQNPSFLEQPLAILQLNIGGLSIHGALVGAIIGLSLFVRKQNLSFYQITDLFAAPLLLGQIVGRLGNYFNQELFGYPTNVPWKLFIDAMHRPIEYIAQSYFHPVFLYEMLLNSVGLWLLLRIPLKKQGIASYMYLLIYGLVRYIVEIFRISESVAFSLSLAQMVSILLICTALVGLFKLSKTARRGA
jgi:phosphatidylglycerol:prolipoprotein diacylglycerol transferase